ncbi:hypothetical protein, partial [Serratia marcescens]|uniref:hypothetical protein n=2 Tax=Serratia TaxID=613 RepID=UPI00344ECD05
ALPTELSGQRGALNRIGRMASIAFCHKADRLLYFQAASPEGRGTGGCPHSINMHINRVFIPMLKWGFTIFQLNNKALRFNQRAFNQGVSCLNPAKNHAIIAQILALSVP